MKKILLFIFILPILSIAQNRIQLFNTDYYVIGRWHAEQWLKKHNISVFEAIEFVQEYEKDNFGETQTYTDAEKLVNMIGLK